MDVTVNISRENADDDPTLSVTAHGATVGEVFELMLAATENVIGRGIASALVDNGATAEEAEYAAPLRTRLLMVETLMQQPFRSFDAVMLDL